MEETLEKYGAALESYDKAIEYSRDRFETIQKEMYPVESEGQDAYEGSTEDIHSNWNNRGDVEMILKKYGAALENYKEAIEYDPENPVYWLNKSHAEKALGDIVEAEKSYKIAETFDEEQNLDVTKDSE